MAREHGFIYLINCEQYTKIGKSIKPLKRHLDISASIPFQTELIQTMPTRDMARAERYLHEMLRRYRVKGEWFCLPEETYFRLRAIPNLDTFIHNGQTID